MRKRLSSIFACLVVFLLTIPSSIVFAKQSNTAAILWIPHYQKATERTVNLHKEAFLDTDEHGHKNNNSVFYVPYDNFVYVSHDLPVRVSQETQKTKGKSFESALTGMLTQLRGQLFPTLHLFVHSHGCTEGVVIDTPGGDEFVLGFQDFITLVFNAIDTFQKPFMDLPAFLVRMFSVKLELWIDACESGAFLPILKQFLEDPNGLYTNYRKDLSGKLRKFKYKVNVFTTSKGIAGYGCYGDIAIETVFNIAEYNRQTTTRTVLFDKRDWRLFTSIDHMNDHNAWSSYQAFDSSLLPIQDLIGFMNSEIGTMAEFVELPIEEVIHKDDLPLLAEKLALDSDFSIPLRLDIIRMLERIGTWAIPYREEMPQPSDIVPVLNEVFAAEGQDERIKIRAAKAITDMGVYHLLEYPYEEIDPKSFEKNAKLLEGSLPALRFVATSRGDRISQYVREVAGILVRELERDSDN